MGFAAKRAAPRTSLAVLFAAAQFADLLWPLLVAAGVEQVRIAPGTTAFTPLDFVSYPYSHSLALLVVWGIAFGAFVAVRGAFGRDGGAGFVSFRADGAGAVVALLVVSHWLLDWITHRPDMPLYPGSARFGLGLWNSVPDTLIVEVAMFAAGVWVYAASTRPRDGVGRWSFAAFVAFLLVAYAGNVFGGPPPSVRAIWILGVIGGAILLAWSEWFDRRRTAVQR